MTCHLPTSTPRRRPLRRLRAVLAVATLAAALVPALAPSPSSAQQLALIPTLSLRVNDNVAILSPEAESLLAQALAAHEAATGTRVVVLTVAATAPESIAAYAERLARAWPAAHGGSDNVVFVVVARDNRPAANRVRIQPGRGLSTPVSEADAQRIVDEEMLPRFALLDYPGALTAGVERLVSLLDGHPLAPRVEAPSPSPTVAPEPESSPWSWPAALVAAVVVVALSTWGLVRARSRRLVHLTGHRAMNRSFEPMVVGRFTGKMPELAPEDGNGFGGHGVGRGFAGGGGDFGGGGATGFW